MIATAPRAKRRYASRRAQARSAADRRRSAAEHRGRSIDDGVAAQGTPIRSRACDDRASSIHDHIDRRHPGRDRPERGWRRGDQASGPARPRAWPATRRLPRHRAVGPRRRRVVAGPECRDHPGAVRGGPVALRSAVERASRIAGREASELEAIVVVGAPHVAIVSVAEAQGASLIVWGSTRARDLRDPLERSRRRDHRLDRQPQRSDRRFCRGRRCRSRRGRDARPDRIAPHLAWQRGRDRRPSCAVLRARRTA